LRHTPPHSFKLAEITKHDDDSEPSLSGVVAACRAACVP
jgi:hypothetical protein